MNPALCISSYLSTTRVRRWAKRYPARIHPSISNPACANNETCREHRSRCDHRAIHISALRNPNRSAVAVTIFVAISKLSFPHASKEKTGRLCRIFPTSGYTAGVKALRSAVLRDYCNDQRILLLSCLFPELPKNMTNPIEMTARVTMTMKSIMGADNNTREHPLSNPRLGMEEPRKRDCLSLTVVLVLHHALVLGQRG